MPIADAINIRSDNEVEIVSAMCASSLHRFSYWREARRFAWRTAHENQLAVVGEDRHGWAVQWLRAGNQGEQA